MNVKHIIWLLLPALCVAGCRKFVQVPDPDTLLGTSKVFSGDETATAALMGMYSRAVSLPGTFLNGGNTLYPSLSADECTPSFAIPAVEEFSDNALESGNSYITQLYGSAYNVIYNANIILENLEKSRAVSAGVRRQIMGEALFVRSLVYSRLVVLWGAVPLLTTTDADKNAVAPRSHPDSVYRQIINDLHIADSLLDTAYAWKGAGAVERTRPNRWAARALFARMSMYMGAWSTAAAAATAVIDSSGCRLEPSLDSVFLKDSREALWQLQPVSSSTNSAEGYYYLPADNPQARPSYILTTALMLSFETGDRRKSRWVGARTIGGIVYNYPAKYKTRTGPPYREYNMVLRLADVYLIRAEARARQDDLTGAIQDLNVVRGRAGLKGLSSSLSRDAVLAAVMQERRVELFAEWGHRWADLLRWGQADAVLSAEKPLWTANAKLYPLPLTDIQRNHALSQNPGY
jgi:hypothetical protein